LWILFNVDRLKSTGQFWASLPVHTDDFSGNKFVAVFTDKDLAQRYLDEHPKDLAREFMPIENLERFRQILGVYLKAGVENVGTDLSSRNFGDKTRFGQLRTIAVFIKQTENY